MTEITRVRSRSSAPFHVCSHIAVARLQMAFLLETLEKSPWSGPQGANSFYEKSGQAPHVPAGDGWIQYRAVFTTPDGDSTPVLEEVCIDVM